MKSLTMILAAVAFATALPAQAQKLDLSTITCKQFLGMKQESITLILMWMQGYYMDQDAAAVIDFEKMKDDAQKLGDYCRENPSIGLITAAEETIAN